MEQDLSGQGMGWGWASRTPRECSAQGLRLMDHALPQNPIFLASPYILPSEQMDLRGLFPACSQKEALERFQSPGCDARAKSKEISTQEIPAGNFHLQQPQFQSRSTESAAAQVLPTTFCCLLLQRSQGQEKTGIKFPLISIPGNLSQDFPLSSPRRVSDPHQKPIWVINPRFPRSLPMK